METYPVRNSLRRRLYALALAIPFVALAGIGGKASAQTFCSEPIRPLCADRSADVGTPTQRMMCIDDLITFEEAQQEYVACVRESIEDAEMELEQARELRECLEDDGGPECLELMD